MALANAYKLAGIEANIPENISYGDDELLEQLEDDYDEFGYNQPVRLYRKQIGDNPYLVFYDYDVIGFDGRNYELDYIKVPLGKAREILKEQSNLIDW